MTEKYVHGYSEKEKGRLVDQASTLTELLHGDTFYSAGNSVLEAGCGVGAQTVILTEKSPDARFTSIDVSDESLGVAKGVIEAKGCDNVFFQKADIFDLPFPDESFDHVFVCFVLEHLENPLDALQRLRSVLKKGGTLTVIEGDHGSTYFHPDSEYAHRTIKCLVDLQAELEGDSLIGRRIYPLLEAAGFNRVTVSPRMVYADAGRPEMVDGFTKKTFIAMVEGVREPALKQGLMTEKDWDRGIKDLYKTTERDGVFCYCFFKGVAIK